MTPAAIAKYRLANQHLTDPGFASPLQIVSGLGAMQAQEYAMAKWAVGLRVPGASNATVEQALNDGAILRTHLLRPTWHFVAPADIRWMLELTAPRVHAVNAFMYRKTELDSNVFKKCCNLFAKLLKDNNYLSRTALKAELERIKITTDTVRLSCIMMYAELEGLLCSGPRQGKQHTYALLEERVPSAAKLTREEANAALALRYFASRGPATLQDYVWWSGLTVKDAKEGIAALPSAFVREMIDKQEYIFAPHSPTPRKLATFLLPDYDEYSISYKDRTALFTAEDNERRSKGDNPFFNHLIVVDGIIGGSWKPLVKGKQVAVTTTFFAPLNDRQHQAVMTSVRDYIAFMGH